jgi:cell division septation protein DedD
MLEMSKKQFFTLGKMVAPAIAAVIVVSITTINGCTPSDQSTEGRDEEISQNALEAEKAEAQLANAPKEGAETKTAQKDAPKETKKAELKKTVAAAAPAHGTTKTDEKKSATRSVASAGGVYVVQVGAFKIKENAEKLQAKLKSAGYQVELESIEHSKNGHLHLVRLPSQSRAEAETMVEELYAKQDMHAQVLAVPQVH